MADNSFHFITMTGPKVPKDPALRTLIRKQAMKGVAIARKKRGGCGKVNVRQAPSESYTSVRIRLSESSGTSTSADKHSSAKADSASVVSATRTETEAITPDNELVLTEPQIQAWLAAHDLVLPLTNSFATDYERLRMKYHFDIRDLSVLTSFSIGKQTMLAIASNTDLLTTILGTHMQSYLKFIPSRYGHKPFLTAVIDCVSAKVHSKLYPRNEMFEGMILRMYAKALACLQEAVAGDQSSLDPDLLCAIQMLSLHEVSLHSHRTMTNSLTSHPKMLEPSRTAAYTHHIQGSALVVQHLTPSRFKTDYEKMLFHAHIGPTFSEAIMTNSPCYLAESQWLKLYESIILDTPNLTDRSELVVRIRMRIVALAAIIPATTAAMDPKNLNPSRLLTLELRAREAHACLRTQLKAYESHILHSSIRQIPLSELALRREILVNALEGLCVYKRIIASVCEPERLQLESETQELAGKIFELPENRFSWMYSAHVEGIAGAVLATRAEWERDLRGIGAGEKWRLASERWRGFWVREVGGMGVRGGWDLL
jgi:hypothetical protein